MHRFIIVIGGVSAFIGFCLGVWLGLFCVFATSAFAQENQHPPQDQELHNQFYSNWMRPDFPALSCCSLKDCYPTEAKFENGNWYAKQRETGQWVRIPPQKIEQYRNAPDVQAHVCMSPFGDVYCFISPAGT